MFEGRRTIMARVIDAVMWFNGFTKESEAREFLANASTETVAEIIRSFEENAVKTFYED